MYGFLINFLRFIGYFIKKADENKAILCVPEQRLGILRLCFLCVSKARYIATIALFNLFRAPSIVNPLFTFPRECGSPRRNPGIPGHGEALAVDSLCFGTRRYEHAWFSHEFPSFHWVFH